MTMFGQFFDGLPVGAEPTTPETGTLRLHLNGELVLEAEVERLRLVRVKTPGYELLHGNQPGKLKPCAIGEVIRRYIGWRSV